MPVWRVIFNGRAILRSEMPAGFITCVEVYANSENEALRFGALEIGRNPEANGYRLTMDDIFIVPEKTLGKQGFIWYQNPVDRET